MHSVPMLTVLRETVDKDLYMYDAIIAGIGVVASKLSQEEAVEAATAFMRSYLGELEEQADRDA